MFGSVIIDALTALFIFPASCVIDGILERQAYRTLIRGLRSG